MVDVEFLNQLVESMEEGVSRMEDAQAQGQTEYFNKLRVFIFDLHRRINGVLEAKDV
jgi:hypothetical protein